MVSTETIKGGILPDRIDALIKRKFNSKLNILIGLRFSTGTPFMFSTGVLYKLIDKLDLELNVNSSETPIQFGIKYKYKTSSIIISSQYHQILGQSIGAQIQFTIL